MPTKTPLILFFCLSAFVVACQSGAREMERGPISKADLIGSCQAADGSDFCGGPSDGNCWCDDMCESFGDCCADKSSVCGGDVAGDCCELADKPPSFEPVECCEDGTWASTGSGNPCSDIGKDVGSVCEEEACCEADDAPQCFEGATCCADGTWACNNGAGNSTCPVDGDVCEEKVPACGDGSLPVCLIAEPPCPDGLVREVVNGCFGECVDPETCEAPAACCDTASKPPSFEPVECCEDGTWASTGSGNPCSDIGQDLGVVCDAELCCLAADEPQCFEGATCCADGTWACNDGAGNSTCSTDGQVCQQAGEGEVCSVGGCEGDLQCCYPCGIPGCQDICMDTGGAGCPAIP